jgi:hypothetical protein
VLMYMEQSRCLVVVEEILSYDSGRRGKNKSDKLDSIAQSPIGQSDPTIAWTSYLGLV